MTEWMGLPALASAHGGQIDGLIGWIHVFMLVLFVGWGGFFAYTLIRFRRSRNPVANYTGVKSHTSSYLEVAVFVVEVVLLFGFAIPMWAARVDHRPPESDAVIVYLTGEQFAWNVRYAGADGVFGRTDVTMMDAQTNPLGVDRADPAGKDDITTLNQLYLPVNKPVIIRLRSKDVIHSFGVPEFRVKQDAIPGLTIPVWFVPTVTTAEMRARTGNPEFQSRSPARSSAVSATTGCGDSSPSRPPRSSRSGWRTKGKSSRASRTFSARLLRRGRPGLRQRPRLRAGERVRPFSTPCPSAGSTPRPAGAIPRAPGAHLESSPRQIPCSPAVKAAPRHAYR